MQILLIIKWYCYCKQLSLPQLEKALYTQFLGCYAKLMNHNLPFFFSSLLFDDVRENRIQYLFKTLSTMSLILGIVYCLWRSWRIEAALYFNFCSPLWLMFVLNFLWIFIRFYDSTIGIKSHQSGHQYCWKVRLNINRILTKNLTSWQDKKAKTRVA